MLLAGKTKQQAGLRSALFRCAPPFAAKQCRRIKKRKAVPIPSVQL